MSDIIKPGIILFAITLIASALLGTVNVMTRDAITENERNTKKLALSEVLPQAKDNNFSVDYIVDPVPDTGVMSYNIGFDGEEIAGFAFTVKQPAYSGKMELLVGIDKDGVITGIKLLKHNETPGLGANADNYKFSSQFIGKSGALSVTKSGNPADNEIDAITAATITSRAVTQGVNTAVEFYNTISVEEGLNK